MVFVLRLGVKMKWRSPLTRDWESIFNLFCAYRPGHTAGERRGGGEERGREGEGGRREESGGLDSASNPTMMKPLK